MKFDKNYDYSNIFNNILLTATWLAVSESIQNTEDEAYYLVMRWIDLARVFSIHLDDSQNVAW